MRKLIIIILFFVLWVQFAEAAEVFFVGRTSVSEGSKITLDLKLKTGQISINSMEFEINYDPEYLEFVGYSDKDSIIKTWIISPRVNKNSINFSGIVPGGVLAVYEPGRNPNDTISVVQLFFKTKKIGQTNVLFNKSLVLKNDGLGSKLEHTDKNFTISIIQGEKTPEKIDKTPPEDFSIAIIHSSFFSKTPELLIFNASDKDSGIKEYKIKNFFGDWFEVTSPYPKKQNLFPQNVVIRAYDYANNFKESSIQIPGLLNIWHYIFLVILCFLAGFWLYKLLK